MIKISLCRKDLEDHGRRRLLNLGHTFAHVLESVSNFSLSHGSAVALGLRCAVKLSVDLRKLKRSEAEMISGLLDQYELPRICELDLAGELSERGRDVLLSDKKRSQQGENVNLVLLKKHNSAYLEMNVPADLVLETLNSVLPVSNKQ